MKREEDEKLWDLLGRATEPGASPFFARNVMRKLREAQGESPPSRSWYLRWLVPAAGVAVVIIAGLALPNQIIKQQRSDSRPPLVALTDSQDNDLMADLDDLMGSDDSGALEDVATL
jgi:anti-sigma factor RsiW